MVNSSPINFLNSQESRGLTRLRLIRVPPSRSSASETKKTKLNLTTLLEIIETKDNNLLIKFLNDFGILLNEDNTPPPLRISNDGINLRPIALKYFENSVNVDDIEDNNENVNVDEVNGDNDIEEDIIIETDNNTGDDNNTGEPCLFSYQLS